MKSKAKITATAIAAVGVVLLVASGAYAGVREYINSFSNVDLVMKDGTTMHADIVKMDGHNYLMIPVDSLPDYLHQQVLKVMHPRHAQRGVTTNGFARFALAVRSPA